jgi:hypothetical protein
VSRANLDIPDDRKMTALAWAAHGGHEEIVELLLYFRADPLMKDIDGVSVLTHAIHGGNTKVLDLVREAQRNQLNLDPKLRVDDQALEAMFEAKMEEKRLMYEKQSASTYVDDVETDSEIEFDFPEYESLEQLLAVAGNAEASFQESLNLNESLLDELPMSAEFGDATKG